MAKVPRNRREVEPLVSLFRTRPPVVTRESGAPSSQRPPVVARVLAGTALAALASLFGDALVVQWTKSRYPSLSNYSHFRLADYGTLTIVGVLGAGFAWWLVTRSVGTPRRVFFRVALVVTVVLWLPDLWLLVRGEPGRAIAAVLVSRDASAASRRRSVWVTMTTLVVAEFVLGLVGMLYVPFSRPNGWISHQGAGLYLAHAVLGGALGLAAGAIVFVVRRDPRASRLERIAAMVGVWGVVVGAIGGGLCYSHSLRLLGMALMFVGVSVAFFGYLIPLLGEDHGATAIRDAHS